MQFPQDNFFYQSYSRFSAEGENDERELLVKQQKLSQARTRKFALETKQRRKALEEKQKQWDFEEKQQRENILQQRKQQVQDVTERFQRAYLPSSNRRRQSLSQIQGFFSQSSPTSHVSVNTRRSRSWNPTPRPPSAPKPFQRQAHKLAPEQREIFPKRDQDEATPEMPQHHSPQDTHGSTSSDSVSSKDSLEMEDHDPSPSTHSTSHLDSEKLHPDAIPVSDPILSPMWLLGEAQNPRQSDDAKSTDNNLPGFKASWGFTSGQEAGPDLNELDNMDQEHFEMNSHNPKDNPSLTSRIAPMNYAALDLSCPKHEAAPDPRQQHVHDERLLTPTLASETHPPSKDSNSTQVLLGAPPKPNIFLNDNNPYESLDEGAPLQAGEEIHLLSTHKELSASINNLNHFLNSDPKPLLQHPPLFNIQSHGDIQSSEEEEVVEEEEEEEEKRAPLLIPHQGVRVIKGILKKPSTGIKDSIELIRARLSDSESSSVQKKKKVRWFDELHQENRNREEMKDKYSTLPKRTPEDHPTPKSSPGLTPAAFSSYHFTKHAWPDVGVQRLQSATRSAGHVLPWREHAARGAAAPVPPRTRKGTVMRPQSATVVTQIGKTQGRVVVPRPPPRAEAAPEDKMATRPPYGTDHPNCKQAMAPEPGEHRGDAFCSPYHVTMADSSSVVYTLLSPSYASPASEDNAKIKLCSGHQETQGCSGRRRALSEKGLCLDSTPTDEDISQLWHGVRSVLVTKDAKAAVNRPTSESGRVSRKPGAEQSRQTSFGAGNRRPPPPAKPSQPVKQSMEPIRKFLNKHNVVCAHEGLASAAQLHLAEGPATGRQEERDHKAAMETPQTLSPGMVPLQQQQQQQQQGPTNLSMEEKKILMSLDRLDHRLLCVQKNSEGSTGTQGRILIHAPLVKETKVTLSHNRQRASSASNRVRHHKKS